MRQERFKLIPAVHIFLVKQNQILLLRRYNTGYEDGNYSVPAGHLDGGEEVVKAAQREAWEETGITVQEKDIQVVGIMHRLKEDERVDFFVEVTKWDGRIENKEPGKCDELAWYDMDHLPDNTIDYIKRAIHNYRNNRWFDSYGWPEQVRTGGEAWS